MKHLFFLVLVFYSTTLHALPGQVIIVRHGEKNTVNFELTSAGVERAEALSSYLTLPNNEPGFVGLAGTTNVVLFDYGLPFALFAARPVPISEKFDDDYTVRCIQTLVPTALKLNLPIHSPYGSDQEDELAQYILNEPRFNGKNIVICWHHNLIYKLIQAFGYLPDPDITPPNSYPDKRFDAVWRMTFPIPNPVPIVYPILQELLYGDPSTFPAPNPPTPPIPPP